MSTTPDYHSEDDAVFDPINVDRALIEAMAGMIDGYLDDADWAAGKVVRVSSDGVEEEIEIRCEVYGVWDEYE